MLASPETRDFIEWARGLGATRVRFGDIEVEFGPIEYVPSPIPRPEMTPEEAAADRKRELDRLLYGSSE